MNVTVESTPIKHEEHKYMLRKMSLYEETRIKLKVKDGGGLWTKEIRDYLLQIPVEPKPGRPKVDGGDDRSEYYKMRRIKDRIKSGLADIELAMKVLPLKEIDDVINVNEMKDFFNVIIWNRYLLNIHKEYDEKTNPELRQQWNKLEPRTATRVQLIKNIVETFLAHFISNRRNLSPPNQRALIDALEVIRSLNDPNYITPNKNGY